MTDETREITKQIDRRSRWKTAGSMVVAFVAFAALAFSATQWATRAQEQEQRADQAEQGEQEAAVAVDQLCAQVRALGGVCVVEPADLRGEAGPPPTDEQVQEAVNLFLLRNPPQPGRAPTMQEIADAVRVQLAANPPERGERGPGPTPEQIAGAVATHLLENPPPAGADGQDGADGADGAPGADSTVPGPPGEPPLEWTFTTRDVVGQPTVHRCERVDEFDPDAPRYECEPVEEEQGVE